MKSMLKGVLYYAVVMMFASLVFSFIISSLSLMFSFADLVGPSGGSATSVGPLSYLGDPVRIEGDQGATFLKIVMTLVYFYILSKMLSWIPGVVGKNIVQKTMSLGKKLSKDGLKDTARNMKSAAQNLSSRDYQRIGRMARHRGWSKLSRVAYGIGDSKELSDMVKKGLSKGKNDGKVDGKGKSDKDELDTNNQKTQDQNQNAEGKKEDYRGKKEDSQDKKNENKKQEEDSREQRNREREERRQREEEEHKNKEEREERERQNKYSTSDDYRDSAQSERDQDVFNTFHREADEAFEALGASDMPGFDDLDRQMDVNQSSEETHNNFLGSSDARQDDVNIPDSQLKNLTATGLSDVSDLDRNSLSHNANKMAENLMDTSESAAGLSGDELLGKDEIREKSILRDESGNAVSTFSSDDIETAGQALSRGVIPYGNVLPQSVTESGDYSVENIKKHTRGNMDNYVKQAPTVFAEQMQAIAEGNNAVSPAANLQGVPVSREVNNAGVEAAVGTAAAMAAGKAVGEAASRFTQDREKEVVRETRYVNEPATTNAPSASGRESISNMSVDDFTRKFANDFTQEAMRDGLLRTNQGSTPNGMQQISLSQSTIDGIANAFKDTRRATVTPAVAAQRVTDIARNDITQAASSNEGSDVEELSSRFKKALEDKLARDEQNFDKLSRKSGMGLSKGSNNGKVEPEEI